MLTLDPLKLLFVLVVAVVVLGPEHLPKAARKAGLLLSDLRRLQSSLHEQATETLGNHPLVTELTSARQILRETLEQASPRRAVVRLGCSDTAAKGPRPADEEDGPDRPEPTMDPGDPGSKGPRAGAGHLPDEPVSAANDPSLN